LDVPVDECPWHIRERSTGWHNGSETHRPR
jgi:hypothetical protein